MSEPTGTEPARAPAGPAWMLYDTAWALVAAAARLRGGGRTRRRSGDYAKTDSGSPCCWINACSLGEVAVALRLIEALRGAHPRIRFALTTTTPEGHALAHERLRAPDRVEWFPHDARGAMRRAYDTLHPDFVVLVEVEFWPNHLREAAARGIPVFAVNSRLTPREERNYRLAGTFMRRVFGIPRVVCAQTPADARRFARLGARRVEVTGNMKFDPEPLAAPDPGRDPLAHTGVPHGAPVLLGASTHPGEEDAILATFRLCRARHPDLVLVLAPRHPVRTDTVTALAAIQGWSVSRLSEDKQIRSPDCIIVDSVGHLRDLYARATAAFIGKSLAARGGQNFLEAAECGCPVVIGPHTENFSDAARVFLEADAIIQIGDAEELAICMEELLHDADRRQQMAIRAGKILKQQRGATARNLTIILEELALPRTSSAPFTAASPRDKKLPV